MKGPVSLRLAKVSKSYGSVQAVAPMDMEIKAGELVALLGPSGCGKTTTLRIIAGFLNEPMLLGCIATIDLALKELSIPHGHGAVQAAIEYLAHERAKSLHMSPVAA